MKKDTKTKKKGNAVTEHRTDLTKVTIYSSYRPLNAYPNQSYVSFGGDDAASNSVASESLLKAWKKTHANRKTSVS